MKKILILTVLAVAFLFTACDKDSPGDNYDFSNSLPPYVALSSRTALSVKEGANAKVTFLMRTTLQQDVTVTYKVEGAIALANQTAVILRDKLSVDVLTPIPMNTIVAPATTAVATLTLVSAVTADGKSLTIGQNADPSIQKVTINVKL